MNNTKIFPYRKYFICIVFVLFIKLFRGGGGGGEGVSLSIIAWERCIKFFISIPIISEFVCALV